MVKAAITAVAGYVPDYVLSNEELSTMVDTNDEWITSRTGIKERRILKGKDRGLSEMCVHAANELLKKRNIKAEELDMVIIGTITGDYVFPSTSNIVCDKIGAKNAWGFDLSAACSGFIFALATGAQFIETGRYKKVMVIGGDKMSSIIDYTDRATCIIFGDGAGAVLLEPTTEDLGIKDFLLRADGAGRNFLCMYAGGSVAPPTHETINAKQHYVYHEGQTVFKFAVKGMADISAEIMEKNNLKAEDISWLV
ncbi:MAG: beta-ketoacyl-ACP synthase III, partial [Candidatus Paceibacterales bacterium]